MLFSSREPFHESPLYSGTGLSAGKGAFTRTTVVTNTWSPQTTGELHERPGMLAFHTTFCVRLQVAGSEGWSGARPACVPRNCGQFSATTGTTAKIATTTVQAAQAR